jgi:DNA-binding response OmpR family regulator
MELFTFLMLMEPIPALSILVVEDNDDLLASTISFLRSHGHRASGFRSAEEVDETPAAGLPDLYLIDWNLPGEDGLSLARRIRASQPLAGIIISSGRGALADRISGYAAGADVYLPKPLDPDELLACIGSLGKRIHRATHPDDATVLDVQGLVLRGPTGNILVSHTEATLLAALCRAPGQQLERWQAMQLIDVDDRGLVPANLEMRITSLRRKLEACGAGADTIRSIRGVGYALTCRLALI